MLSLIYYKGFVIFCILRYDTILQVTKALKPSFKIMIISPESICIPESLNTTIIYMFLTSKYPLWIHNTHTYSKGYFITKNQIQTLGLKISEAIHILLILLNSPNQIWSNKKIEKHLNLVIIRGYRLILSWLEWIVPSKWWIMPMRLMVAKK